MTANYLKLPLIGKIKHPSRWLLGLATTGVVVMGTTYFVVDQAKPKLDIAQLTVPAEAKNVTLRINASGKVVPIQSVNLSPKTAGVLVNLLVEQGDKVEAGQIIARMDNADLQAQLIGSKARLAQAQAELDKARTGSRPEQIAAARARLAGAEAQLDEARNGTRREEIEQATAQVESAQARVNLASTRVERNRTLYQLGAISQDKLDEVLADQRSTRASLTELQRRLAQLKSGSRTEEIAQRQAAVKEAKEALREQENGTRPEDIASSKAGVNAALGELKGVQVKLEDTIVRAPFAGVVTQKYATEGAFVTPTTSASSTASATSTSIVAIARGLEILAEVPEADIGQIKPGQSVEIVADSFPEKVFKGHVRLVSPEAVLKENVTSFQVKVALDTGKDQLLSGMNVNLTFLGTNLKDALVVPTVAIVTEKGKTGVLVPDQNNKPLFRPVTIGSSIQDQTQIVQGLNPGDRVFINLPKDQQPKQEKDEG